MAHDKYRLIDYDYTLPESLIAQKPAGRRDRSRLMRLARTTGQLSHGRFDDVAQVLGAGDVLVVNNTRVVPGRLLGRKESGGRVEVLILDYAQGVDAGRFTCLVKASKRPKPGSRFVFDQGVTATTLQVDERTCMLEFDAPFDFDQVLARIGHVPLPPYVKREDTSADLDTYQTVYATHNGAIAAPTAGLHFSRALLDQLSDKEVRIVPLTLHVGYGTFLPVQHEDIRHHRMHAEWFDLSEQSARIVNTAKTAGRRIVAVGTTCVRTLEYCAGADGRLTAQTGMCDLFIYPGFDFKVIDGMITNFHLPKSTLLMLVCAFAGRESVLAAYRDAVEKKYRFYSYGDGMVIL